MGSVGLWKTYSGATEESGELLKKCLGEGVDLIWMRGEAEYITGVIIKKWGVPPGKEKTEAVEISEGSRRDGHTAAGTTKKGFYLGQVATVIDAEMLGVAMGWEQSKRVLTDSQVAIGRAQGLKFERPRSQIEQIVVTAQSGKEKEIAWVKAYDGIPGNEYAGDKAQETGSIGRLLNQRQTATPGGIRALFRSNRISTQVKTWDRNSLRGLTYITTDRGPQTNWLCRIGKAEEDKCKCRERGPNGAHIMKCKGMERAELWRQQGST